ncbi:radical SAM/SPASM domain-containing protein [Belnapia sp. T6]|uniref:Radical SAM/SPASM domain-containing protein n=1 Tax=Belnapia mucosa TaxID=2804532 RepID=A0ABS1V5H0_9PROT|nr:radical SAM/SPASM domain-containing protein [Belnapia mucosa]MBL6456945.1 radical SAM/SPASM domain-containing protein [Belnapia mucosa]
MIQDILFEQVTPPPRHRPALPDPHGPGCFYSRSVPLPAATMAGRIQLMLPPDLPPGQSVTAEILGQEGEVLATVSWPVAAETPEAADHLMMAFTLEAPQRVTLRLTASTRAGSFYLRAAKLQRAVPGQALDWSGTHGRLNLWPLDRIRFVMVGNSGICTASCLHCPTNKPWLPVPRGEVMAEAIFERLAEGLATCGLPIGGIGFGLFGDPLIDRRLAERIRRLKALLPGVPVTVSTTGAAFVPRQAPVVEAVDSIGVHVESLVPETYEALMAPLRFAEVIPRVERLVALAGPKAILALPVHQRNRAEIADLEAWWRRLGGGGVEHQSFTNRANLDPAVTALHLSPVTGACTQDLAYDLIVDWDGRVLTCCNDFAKRSNLGSLATAPLDTILADARRERLFRQLRHRDWQQIEGCRTCLFDDPAATQAAAAASRAEAQARSLAIATASGP